MKWVSAWCYYLTSGGYFTPVRSGRGPPCWKGLAEKKIKTIRNSQATMFLEP